MKLAAFDSGIISYGCPAGVRTHETIVEAAMAELLGYDYFFVSEHHEPWAAWANPVGLVAAITASTSRIEVGAAGFLARYHDPTMVATALSAVDRVYGGRVVLGLCPSFQAGLKELHPRSEFDSVCVPAFQERWPRPVWLFGRNGTLDLANRLGLPFGYSLFHVHDKPANPADLDRYTGPLRSIWVCAVCDESRERAETQKDVIESSPIRASVNLCGTPADCLEQLKPIVEAYRPDIIGITPGWPDSESRKFTYQALTPAQDW